MALTDTERRFEWNSQVVMPSEEDEWWWHGSQVLNYYPCDKDYRNHPPSVRFVEKYLGDAIVFNTDASTLKFASDSITVDGALLEMGTGTGRTVNFIAALNPEKKIYSFDSFLGLPEDWGRSDLNFPPGTFAMKDQQKLPLVLHNVMVIKGMFGDTLPEYKRTTLKDKPVAFLHIDCELYSSTKQVFELLEEHIVPGTIIAFDELYNYPGFEEHEFKALQEFLAKTGKQVECLAYNQYFEQVVVRVI